MRAAVNLVVVLLLSLPSSTRADWIRILPGPTEHVVANAGYAAALRDGDVWLVRDDGSVAGRLSGRRREGAKSDRRTSQGEAEGILDYLDVAEADRDEDWALDLVYDERTLAQRKRARASSPSLSAEPGSAALAAGGGNIWIATKESLLRIGSHDEVVRESGRGQHGQLLAAGTSLVVARSDGFHLMPMGDGPERIIPVPAGARNVVLSVGGQRWAYSSAAGVFWAKEDGSSGHFASERAVVDLAYCGETLVILLEDALVAVANDQPEVRSRAVIAKRLFCSDGASGPWLASGRSLLISADQGREWQTIETPAGVEIAAIAATTHHLWLATDAGLFYSSARGQPAPRPDTQAGARGEGGRRRLGPASWLSWLPQVSLRAKAVTGPMGRQVEALAYATIPLDPRRLPVTAVAMEESVAPIPAPGPSRPTVGSPDMRDPDRHCLVLTKRKAVELAMSEPERASSYITRAGRAAWLPELRILVSRRYGRSESLDVGTSSTALASPLGIDTVNDIRYEARATWDLARLVFSAEELAAQNQAMHMAELRRDIESTVNRLYFERRRLALEVGGTDGWSRRLRGAEISAELDSLTGGAFGACTGDASKGGR